MNLSKMIITIIVSLFFSVLLITKIKAGIALSIVCLFVPVYWIISKNIDEKKYVLIFFIIYPLLPVLAGLNLGAGIPALKFQRIVVLLLLLFLMSKNLLFKYYGDFLKSNIFTFNLVIILVSMFVTSIFSSNFQGSFFFLLSFILELLIFTVVVFSVFKTDEDINQLINSLLIACALLCIFGVIEKVTGYNFYSQFGVFDPKQSRALVHQMRGGGIRVQGPFDHSISYAAFIITILPLFLYKFRNNFKYFNGSILLVMSAIMASQSRSGILGAGIIFLLYILFVERKNLVLIIILAIPVIIYNASDILQYLVNLNPFTTTSSEMANSTEARGKQFIMMSGLIKQSIAFGYGSVEPAIPNLESVDNFYLSYVYQYGLVGMVAYFMLLITFLIKPFRKIGKRVIKERLILLIMFSIIAFAVINSLVTLWSYHFVYYIYIGVVARLIVNSKNAENTRVINY